MPLTGGLKKTPPAKKAFDHSVNAVLRLKFCLLTSQQLMGDCYAVQLTDLQQSKSLSSQSTIGLNQRFPGLYINACRCAIVKTVGFCTAVIDAILGFIEWYAPRFRPSAGLLRQFCQAAICCWVVWLAINPPTLLLPYHAWMLWTAFRSSSCLIISSASPCFLKSSSISGNSSNSLKFYQNLLTIS